jgi:hypothetical protein
MSSFTCTEERPHADSANPLRNTGILHHILGYVGPGHWLFLALVSAEWREAYLRVPPLRIRVVDEIHADYKVLVCPPQMTLARAAFASQSCLRLAHKSGMPLTAAYESSLQHIAGRHGDEETLQAAQELGLVLSVKAVEGAAEAGCMHKVQWLCQQPSVSTACVGNLTRPAAKGGNVAILSWLAGQGYGFGEYDLQAAAEGGHVPAMQYLRTHGCEWPAFVCLPAAGNGHLEALQWLRQQGCNWNTQLICGEAARSGSVPLMRWLQQLEGVTITGFALNCAAEYGHTALCKYLHDDVGIAWSESVTSAATKGCQVETLRWLLAQGCPEDPMEMCVSAAEGGCIELMAEYLQQVQQSEHTAEAQQELLTDMLNAAGAHCHLEAAQWARERGAEWPEKLHYEGTTYADWYGATLEWARGEGCNAPLECDSDSNSDEDYFSDDYGSASGDSDDAYDSDAYDDSEGSDFDM